MSSNTEEQGGGAPLSAAPLYVTIGPPCSGKTTLLQQAQVKDVALDNQPSVFIPIETPYFTAEKRPKWMNKTIFGRSLAQRVQQEDQAELRLVLQRLQKNITVEQMQESFQTLPSKNSEYNTTIVPKLVQTVEKFGSTPLPPTVDLFIQQSIYLPDQRTNLTGLESVQIQLENTSVQQAVAWGNTNTRPNEYKVAMEMAARQGRPVHFIVYGEESEHVEDDVIDMQATYDDLLYRNLNRLLQTGRYIPATVIWDMRQRSIDLVDRAIRAWKRDQDKILNAASLEPTTEPNNTQSNSDPEPMDVNASSAEQTAASDAMLSTTQVKRMTKMDLHRYLAGAINFDMKEDRTVVVRNITQHRKPRCNATRAWNNMGRGRDFRPWDRGGSRREQAYSGRGYRPARSYGGRPPNRWSGNASTNRTQGGREPTFAQGRGPPVNRTQYGRSANRWNGRSSASRSRGTSSWNRGYGRPPSNRSSGGPTSGRSQCSSPGREPTPDGRPDGWSSPGRGGPSRPSSGSKAGSPLKRTRPADET